MSSELFKPPYKLLMPRLWLSWLGLALMRLSIYLPPASRSFIARYIGKGFARFARKKYLIAKRNIALCFPELSASEQQNLLQKNLQNIGMMPMETALSWWASDKTLAKTVDFEGLEHLQSALDKGRGVILLTGHFTSMELGGRLMMLQHPLHVMFHNLKNPLMNQVMLHYRKKHSEGSILQADIRGLFRALKANKVVWYAPDQDFGGKTSVFAKFFGVTAATIIALPRLAERSGAAVVPFMPCRQPDGRYLLKLFPALNNYPSGNDLHDAQRFNDLLETQIRQYPEQYLWVHRRFKTQPDGRGLLYSCRPKQLSNQQEIIDAENTHFTSKLMNSKSFNIVQKYSDKQIIQRDNSHLISSLVSEQIIIWRLIDGKPGHENQSLGLAKALQRIRSCRVIDIPVSGKIKPLAQWLSGVWPAGQGLPLPDLILGAGHRTHLPMLAARRAYGGKTVLMMQPSLPVGLFDLCLIPEHDQYKGGGCYLETRGVLNSLHGIGDHHSNASLIMLGGPSKHCGWDNHSLMHKIAKLLADNPHIHYILTTSRRTPAETLHAAQLLNAPNLQVVPFSDTPPGWIEKQLANVGSAWISEDSVSMVYEALSARVAVGTLPVPIKRQNRVSNGLQQLLSEGLIVRFDYQQTYQKALHPVHGFIEADRCAEWIEGHWLSQPVPSTSAIVSL